MSFTSNISILLVHSYSILTDVLRGIATPLLKTVSDNHHWDLEKRQKLPSPVRDFRERTVVWVHASSLGEAKLLCKFVDMLCEKHPDDRYVVTATTRTGVAYLEKARHPSFCAVGFQPLDSLTLVDRIITHYNVQRLWLLETELWPSLLYACGRRSVPVGIVNGRIEKDSFIWYRRLRWLLLPLFNAVTLVFAQSDEYGERFAALGVNRASISTVGNIKGHIRIGRPERQKWRDLRRSMNIDEDAFVVTAGCWHRGEGKALSVFYRRMQELDYPCKLIIVPRYLDETLAIIEEFGENVVHLDAAATSRAWDVCIIEKVAILDAMYMLADAAIIGGTFTDIGGHNVWDAACFGIPVFFGPSCEKQKESCTAVRDAGVGFSVSDGTELADRMYEVVKNDPMRFLHAQKAFITLTNQAGSVLEPLIP